MTDRGKCCFLWLAPGRSSPSCRGLHCAFPKPAGMNPSSGFSLTFFAVIVLEKLSRYTHSRVLNFFAMCSHVCSHNAASIWEESRNQFGLLPSAKTLKKKKKERRTTVLLILFFFIIIYPFEFPAFHKFCVLSDLITPRTKHDAKISPQASLPSVCHMGCSPRSCSTGRQVST